MEEEQSSGTQAGETAEPSLSLASILGDSLTDGWAGEPAEEEEPISLVDVESGAQQAVEAIGVSAEDVMALIDNA